MILKFFNPFHATGLFLYLLKNQKTSGFLMFTVVLNGFTPQFQIKNVLLT